MDGALTAPTTCFAGLPLDDVLAASPFRRPDWRRIVAEHFADEDCRPCPPWDDLWTLRAWNFLMRGPCAAEYLSGEHPPSWLPILHASRFHGAPNQLPRLELEARMLTGAPLNRIAKRCELDCQLVEAYEHTFFDVRRRLRCRPYILHQVIGPQAILGIKLPQDLGVLWKLVAFYGGNLALDAIMDATWLVHRPARLDETTEFYAQNSDAATARELFLLTLALQGRELGLRDAERLIAIAEELEPLAEVNAPLSGLLAVQAGRHRKNLQREAVFVALRMGQISTSSAAPTTEQAPPVLPEPVNVPPVEPSSRELESSEKAPLATTRVA